MLLLWLVLLIGLNGLTRLNLLAVAGHHRSNCIQALIHVASKHRPFIFVLLAIIIIKLLRLEITYNVVDARDVTSLRMVL